MHRVRSISDGFCSRDENRGEVDKRYHMGISVCSELISSIKLDWKPTNIHLFQIAVCDANPDYSKTNSPKETVQ